MLSNRMPWQLHFLVFFFGGPLSFVGSTLYKSGVQHNVPISNLAAAGCVPCHESPYGSNLKSLDITTCTGPYLFVGIQKEEKSVLEIGALTSVEVLRTDAPKSAPYLSNGVYWHFMKGCSFGFDSVEYSIDSKIDESSRSLVSAHRGISWSIDNSIGCTNLDDLKMSSAFDTSNWRKHIYNCPGTFWCYLM